MYVLDLENAVSMLKKTPDVSAQEFPGLSGKVDAEKFKKFYTVMCARTPEDIADITAEELLELWEHIPEYAVYFEEGKQPCSLDAVGAARSMTTRRIL